MARVTLEGNSFSCVYALTVPNVCRSLKKNNPAVAAEDLYGGGLLGTDSGCFQYFGQENLP